MIEIDMALIANPPTPPDVGTRFILADGETLVTVDKVWYRTRGLAWRVTYRHYDPEGGKNQQLVRGCQITQTRGIWREYTRT